MVGGGSEFGGVLALISGSGEPRWCRRRELGDEVSMLRSGIESIGGPLVPTARADTVLAALLEVGVVSGCAVCGGL